MTSRTRRQSRCTTASSSHTNTDCRSWLLAEAGEGKLLRMPPDEDRAELLRRHLKVARCTREALTANDAQRSPVRFHSLRDLLDLHGHPRRRPAPHPVAGRAHQVRDVRDVHRSGPAVRGRVRSTTTDRMALEGPLRAVAGGHAAQVGRGLKTVDSSETAPTAQRDQRVALANDRSQRDCRVSADLRSPDEPVTPP
jgi:hypothetical protein